MEGTRPPAGASPTQPYKCGQNVKVKVKINTLACAEIKKLTLTLNILTAFIRLGRAGPVGAGCPPYSQALGRVPSIFTDFVPSIILF